MGKAGMASRAEYPLVCLEYWMNNGVFHAVSLIKAAPGIAAHISP